ncbi:ClpXP protease specificity-enhancing factor [Pseudoxanthomonas daejeonensis]|jgi:stringent starvation protein B|uniref:ClpXP protease specificity-enhancing factor n=1 Tax=Pseudoxanthomonas daejeonensis TaxID=266062 RepID=UPI001F545F0F|nr:ClpXP protease specificity-enhancing factor [Pseudoxanthomonas daejeonensis]UNK56695.1 ClpXP protease specificity-enhancing factor [Pseudoxanthomonas daejeonensis]
MSDDATPMTSYRPYLLRALTEWINDNGMTPHILVDAGMPGVRVPPGTVREGRVVLNIADRAVVGLQMDNEWIGFTARFGGVSQPVHVPIGAVLAVYARETGQGMVLPEEAAGGSHAHGDEEGTETGGPDTEGPDTPPDGPANPSPGKRPHLRVVK